MHVQGCVFCVCMCGSACACLYTCCGAHVNMHMHVQVCYANHHVSITPSTHTMHNTHSTRNAHSMHVHMHAHITQHTHSMPNTHNIQHTHSMHALTACSSHAPCTACTTPTTPQLACRHACTSHRTPAEQKACNSKQQTHLLSSQVALTLHDDLVPSLVGALHKERHRRGRGMAE